MLEGENITNEVETEDTRARQVWGFAKLLRRLQQTLNERDVDVIFRCRKCGEMLGWVDGQSGPEAVCDCAIREVREL